MIKNHKLAKAIQDCSWSTLVTQLEYKCDWYGKKLVKINSFYASSKICNHCGYKLDKLDLNIRSWICPSCNQINDRDINAAKNILDEGLKLINQLD